MVTTQKKMPIELTRYIELILKDYPKTVQYLNKIRDTLDSPNSGVKYGKSRRTKMASIVEVNRIERLELIVQAVTNVIEEISALAQPYKEFIQLKYWNKHEELTMDGIALKIHVSRRTAFYMKERILYSLAWELGEWL